MEESMVTSALLSWLAVVLTVVLSILPAGGPGKALIPLLGKAPPPTKLGIAGATPAQVKALGGSWYYNFGPTSQGDWGVEAVPMIPGSDVPQKVGGNSDYILGMNEPDKSGASNLTPEQGAQIWRKIELTFPNKRLISPGPSHENADWLVRFRDAYKAAYGRWPRLDGLAMHCYIVEPGGCIALGQRYVEWARAWGVPEIWVTEFAYLPKWAPNAEGQARDFVAWMEAEPLVKRYSPWTAYIKGGEAYWPHTDPAANPSLFAASDSTELTAMGWWYKR